MKICSNPKQLQTLMKETHKTQTIGFVPTMGYLHEGHASLMKIAREKCDFVVVSIFVNPLQFAPHEDLDSYPRDPKRDEEICAQMGVDLIFRPTEMYDAHHSTFVEVERLTDRLCGASRPTHFRGVCTVVARLFGLVQPDVAVFGEKDFQQLAVIRRMVQDLAMPIEIIGGPLIRDTDGMALSSRNRYLSLEERSRGQSISQTLFLIQEKVREGNHDLHEVRKIARETLRVDELDYLEFMDPDLLTPVKDLSSPTRVLIAAWVGETRLIDNLLIEP